MFGAEIVFLCTELFILALVFFLTDSRSWLDNESKSLLNFIYFATAICATLVFFLPQELKGPLVTLAAAALASVGWVITNFQNRKFNRLQYTNTQIDHSRNDPEIQRATIAIRAKYPKIEPIALAECEVLRNDYSNPQLYDYAEKTAPTLYFIMHMLNFFERLAYLYFNDLVEKRLMYRQFNSVIGMQMVRIQQIVKMIRKTDTKGKAYNDLQKLLVEWYGYNIDDAKDFTVAMVTNSRIEKYYTTN